MSASIPATIDPNTTSGNDLAALLNDFFLCFASSYKSTGTRPTNLAAGGTWLDDTNDPVWDLKMYDGTDDITMLSVDTTNNTASIPGSSSTFTILKNTDDAVGAKLVLQKQRPSGDQVLDQDNIGDLDFNSREDTPVNFIAAQVRAEATEDHTSANQGTKILIRGTDTGSAALKTYMALKDSKIGMGTDDPSSGLEVSHNDGKASIKVKRIQNDATSSTVTASKARTAGSGQVLNNDAIGSFQSNSTDDGGTEFTCFKIETSAVENHTSSARGVRASIQLIKPGETALSEVSFIDENGIGGASQTTSNLEDKAATRVLETIDGAVYGRAVIDVGFYGKDTSDNTRIQNSRITCIYNIEDDVWETFEETEQTSSLVKFVYTGTTVLQVEYLNQIDDINFDSGKIYKDVKRNVR